MTDPRFAIILAGGRGSRMGGADKPSLRVGGRRLIDAALDAVVDADRVVVVGPARDLAPTILQTREDPPGSGPAPAVAAGLAALDADTPPAAGEVTVLAADVPFLTSAALTELARSRRAANAPAAFALDSAGRMQYLVGIWEMSALRESLSAATGPAMRGLIPAGAIGVLVADDIVADVDTADDLDRAQRVLRAPASRLTPPEARAALRDTLTPLAATRLPVGDTLGAVLATGLRAEQPFPTFDASAMDGYAVAGPGPWRVDEQSVAAGANTHPALSPGQAVRIATGAMLPPGADRVIRDEEIGFDDENLLVATTSSRDDTRRRGSEWEAGAELIAAGTPVDDAVVSVARSAGVAALDVRGPLRVVVHATGDEIAADAARPGTIVDTASEAVRNLLLRNGCHAQVGAHLGDRRAAFSAALADPDADLIVLIGATGRGVADHLRGSLSDIGARVVVDGVDVRPGGSLLVATCASGRVIVGLGGNPLAAVTGAALLIGTLADTLLATAARRPELIVVENLGAVARDDGWRMMPVTPNGSGQWSTPTHTPTAHLSALVGARGFALIPPAARDADLVELFR